MRFFRDRLVEAMQEAVEAADHEVVAGWVVILGLAADQIELNEDADARCAGSIRTDGVEAVTVVDHDLPRAIGRAVADAAADTGGRVAGLFQAGPIIHN